MYSEKSFTVSISSFRDPAVVETAYITALHETWGLWRQSLWRAGNVLFVMVEMVRTWFLPKGVYFRASPYYVYEWPVCQVGKTYNEDKKIIHKRSYPTVRPRQNWPKVSESFFRLIWNTSFAQSFKFKSTHLLHVKHTFLLDADRGQVTSFHPLSLSPCRWLGLSFSRSCSVACKFQQNMTDSGR